MTLRGVQKKLRWDAGRSTLHKNELATLNEPRYNRRFKTGKLTAWKISRQRLKTGCLWRTFKFIKLLRHFRVRYV